MAEHLNYQNKNFFKMMINVLRALIKKSRQHARTIGHVSRDENSKKESKRMPAITSSVKEMRNALIGSLVD